MQSINKENFAEQSPKLKLETQFYFNICLTYSPRKEFLFLFTLYEKQSMLELHDRIMKSQTRKFTERVDKKNT